MSKGNNRTESGQEPEVRFPSITGPLNRRERILLTLLAAGAVIETELIKASAPVTTSYALSSFEAQDYFRKKRLSSTTTLSYLLAKKFIVSRGLDKQKTFQLADDGLNYLFAKFPALKYGKWKWDGYWRVVIYDIAEKDSRLRDRLRRELKRLGFKFVQKSVWLTPLPVENDLEAFLKKEKLWGRIIVLKSLMPPAENRRFAVACGYKLPGNPEKDKKAAFTTP